MKLGQNVSEQLSKLGIPQEVMVGRLETLDRSSLARLSRLGTGFNSVAGQTVRANKFDRKVNDSRQDILKPWSNPSPAEVLDTKGQFLAGSYYQEQAAVHPSANDPFPALFNRHRRRGAIMVQRLLSDDVSRKAFERGTQLNVVNDGRADGAVSVSAMVSSPPASNSSSAPRNMMDIFMAMDEAVMREAASIGLGVTGASDLIFGANSSSGAYGGLAGSEGIIGRGMEGNIDNGNPTDAQSVDLMTFKLKRLMDKRQQAYDLYRSVFDKANEAAKTAINNMRA